MIGGGKDDGLVDNDCRSCRSPKREALVSTLTSVVLIVRDIHIHFTYRKILGNLLIKIKACFASTAA